ncbi:MAG: Diguanylate-cyclase [Devosia sp.]|nr:Diguanylate-cyclase [Devosia sp.]
MSLAPTIASGIVPTDDMQQVDDTLRDGFRLLRFPRALEARFECDTGAARTRHLISRSLIGLLLFNVFLLSDYKLMPDTIWLAAVLRLLVVTPFVLAIMVCTAKRPPAWMRESLQGVALVLAAAVPPIVIAFSANPLRESGPPGILLVVMFAGIILHLRFWYALVAMLVIEAIYVATLAGLTTLAFEEALSFNMVFLGGVIFSLVAAYSLEHGNRQTYLLQLRDSLINGELEAISRRDPLTGLGNRRALDATLDALADTGVTGEELALLLLDIDHFKAYNDTLGHQAGDACLKLVADLIRSELRIASDTAYRFGGEEFLIVLRRTEFADATHLAERLRRHLEASALPHPATAAGIVTVSLGVAAARLGPGVTGAELIGGADAALYAAKHAGRNQVWPRPSRHRPTLVDEDDRLWPGDVPGVTSQRRA